jgi:hypothetical protein
VPCAVAVTEQHLGLVPSDSDQVELAIASKHCRCAHNKITRDKDWILEGAVPVADEQKGVGSRNHQIRLPVSIEVSGHDRGG